jgi:mannose-6-phosphate isomerase-like protein (cupin superfamily)
VSYSADAGAVSAALHPDAGAEKLQIGTTLATFVAPGTHTEGRFGLYRWEMAGNTGGAGAHFHRTFSESFYVLDGTVELCDGDSWTSAGAGDFLYVPEGGIHGFRKPTPAPATMLILFAPGAPREDYFRELADIVATGRTLTPDEWTELLARHDQYMVPD